MAASRFLFHLRLKFDAPPMTLAVPFVVVLRSEDRAVLLAAGDDVFADLSDILRDHRERILPKVSFGGLPLPGEDTAIPTFHGRLISVQFSVRPVTEQSDRYHIFSFPGGGGGGGGGSSSSDADDDGLYSIRSAQFTLHALVFGKEAEVARKRAAVLSASKGLASFVLPAPAPRNVSAGGAAKR